MWSGYIDWTHLQPFTYRNSQALQYRILGSAQRQDGVMVVHIILGDDSGMGFTWESRWIFVVMLNLQLTQLTVKLNQDLGVWHHTRQSWQRVVLTVFQEYFLACIEDASKHCVTLKCACKGFVFSVPSTLSYQTKGTHHKRSLYMKAGTCLYDGSIFWQKHV